MAPLKFTYFGFGSFSRAWKAVQGFLRLTRAFMSIILGLSAVAGLLLSGRASSMSEVMSAFFCEMLISGAGFALNDILDQNRDIGVLLKPLPAGVVSRHDAIGVMLIMSIGGLIASAFLGIFIVLLAGSQLMIVAGYSALKKKSGLAANLTTALLCSSAFAVGPIRMQNWGIAWLPFVLCFMFITGREIVKDILDKEVDEGAGVPTVPILYGLRASAWIASLCTATSIVFSLVAGYFVSMSFQYFVLIGFADALLLYGVIKLLRKPDPTTASIFLQASSLAFAFCLAALLG